MMFFRLVSRPTWHYRPLVAAMTMVFAPTAFAQGTTLPASETVKITQDQRMGDWLSQQLHQKTNQNIDESAIVWQSASEQSVQQRQQKALIQQLKSLNAKHTHAIAPLIAWLERLPATGRVHLPQQDARYLQVNPQLEPVLKQGDQVQLSQRTTVVNVLFDDARACQVQHEPTAQAQDYIKHCMSALNKSFYADTAYLITPQGDVQQVNIAKWNAQTQTPPAAGAWLWVPEAKHGWTKETAQKVAQLIASQGTTLALPYHQGQQVLQLQQHSSASRDLPVTSSDWGITGLLQTPTARMQKAGTASLHVSHTDPYTQYNIVLQPFDRLETAMRYTNVKGVSYGPVSPNQDLKDKSLDVKLKLLKESRYVPEVAVGWRDPVGTSLFGGEYVVANKRYGDFDFSLGLGWGYLGKRADIDNPLGAISNRFKQRVYPVASGGEASPETWFTGKTALFGGVQWHSPYQPLIVKLEYDGNDYKSERHIGNKYQSDIPVNVGLTWLGRNVELSAAVERGNTAMFGIAFRGDLSQVGQYKAGISSVQQGKKGYFNPAGLSFHMPIGKQETNLTQQQQVLEAVSQATGWKAFELTHHNQILTVKAEDDGGVYLHERVKNAAEILQHLAPANTKIIQVQLYRQGEAVSTFSIAPSTWQQQYQQLTPTSQRIAQPFTVSSSKPAKQPSSATVAKVKHAKGSISITPDISQSIGGPNGYLFGMYASANANYQLWQGAWVNATGQVRIADNYDKYTFTAESALPRVRTNIRQYMTTSRVLMPNLQLTQFKQLDNHLYGLVYAGYLESMFAGVGGEVLYRPANRSWAIGADINRVRQRDFDQQFALQDYEVTTGHVNFYWNMPWYNVNMKLSAGQYLAGDRGATLDLSRTFKNGVTMGAWATKTNISAAEFGEGSFDKGIYVDIPFDAIFKRWSAGKSHLIYHPLLRDGGARLNRTFDLYNLTSPASKHNLQIKNPLGY
ncbi:MAG: YjbH domain-containing protein [Acinetobacter sp.]|nr:YjbH domain-containing protein [Acinetobacter sp.]